MHSVIPAIASFLAWYWDVFGFDFMNPYFWLTVFCMELVAVPLGAWTAWRYGMFSEQAIAVYCAATVAGLYVNHIF